MVTMLPDASWLQREDLARLVAALGTGQARYVGGAVRDTLLGLPVKDIDMATALEPDEVIRRLRAHGIQVVPTGIAHGTVTAVLPGGPVEITTLRHDVSTDGRRATIAFASDWQEDAARRDFTINALYADPATRKVFDWFDGLDDLAVRRVRFIGDARARIREDHLRILRYFRFQARFGSQPADPQAEEAVAELAATLKGLSRERVGMEMLNLLSLPDPAPTVARMAELGVLAVVLPEADVAALAALIVEEARQNVSPDALRRLAALLPAEVPLAEAIASRFRLSGAQKKRLALAAGRFLPGTGRNCPHPCLSPWARSRAGPAAAERRQHRSASGLGDSRVPAQGRRYCRSGHQGRAAGCPHIAGGRVGVDCGRVRRYGNPCPARQRARAAAMSALPLDTVLLALVTLAVLTAAAGWMMEKDRPALANALRRTGYLGMLAAGLLLVGQLAQQAEKSDASILLGSKPRLSVEGSETVIPLSSDGHYWVRATINGAELDLMIDTGATITSLSQDGAEAVGLVPDPLVAPALLNTANGQVMARAGIISELSFGTITARNLEAMILPAEGLDTNVLGMNLLNQLVSWRVENERLILVPKQG